MVNKYRILIYCFVGFIIVYCLYFVVLKGISLYNENSVVDKIMLHTEDAEIAIFGSSVAWVHFDPKIIESETGLTVHNFGVTGATLPQYKGLLKEFL